MRFDLIPVSHRCNIIREGLELPVRPPAEGLNGNLEVHTGRPGDFFIFKPGKHHSFTTLSASHTPHIHFDLLDRPGNPEIYTSFKPFDELSREERDCISEDVVSVPSLNLPDHIRSDGFMEAADELNDIIEESARKHAGWMLITGAGLLRILGMLMRQSHIQRDDKISLNMNRLILVQDYIRQNYNKKDVTLDGLLQISGLNPFYLCRLFSKTFAASPMHYLNRLRIEKSRELLTYSCKSITEIAEITGYDSIHSFSRAFKRVTGLSPREFRLRCSSQR